MYESENEKERKKERKKEYLLKGENEYIKKKGSKTCNYRKKERKNKYLLKEQKDFFLEMEG